MLQYLDVAIVLIGAIVALVLGAPAFGVIVGAIGWVLQRALQIVDRRATAKIRDSLRRAGIRWAEAFGRTWLLAGAILVAAIVGNRHDGLAAAIVILVAYSVAFGLRIINGAPPESEF